MDHVDSFNELHELLAVLDFYIFKPNVPRNGPRGSGQRPVLKPELVVMVLGWWVVGVTGGDGAGGVMVLFMSNRVVG